MSKLYLLLSIALLWGGSLQAQFGKKTPSEMQSYIDSQTGQTITILTDTTRNDKYLYQTDPMWTSNGNYLLFRSSSRGDGRSVTRVNPDGKEVTFKPTQYFFIEQTTGEIIQVTDCDNIANVYLASNSNQLFISRNEANGWNLYSLDLNALFNDVNNSNVKRPKQYERHIGLFPSEVGKAGGFAIDCNDDYAYIGVERKGNQDEYERMMEKAFVPGTNQPLKIKPVLSAIYKMNISSGEVSKVVDTDFKIGHIQTSRFIPGEIVFCNETGGDAYQRMWFCTADGSIFKPLYEETPLDWVTHETFASQDYVYFNILGFQPRLRKQASGIARINLRTGDVELIGQVEMEKDREAMEGQLTGRGFWHCNASNDNRWAAGDTFGGNVWLINVANGQRYWVASDTKMKPDHAHPSFSPDGNKLLFQSGHFTNGKRLNLMMIDLSAFQ